MLKLIKKSIENPIDTDFTDPIYNFEYFQLLEIYYKYKQYGIVMNHNFIHFKSGKYGKT